MDRWALHRLLVITQVVQALLVLTIPMAILYGQINVFVVLATVLFMEALSQLAYPAQLAVLPRIVPPEHLVPANSAMSFAYQGANLVFNAAGGLLIPLVGFLGLYAADSITFVAAALAFSRLVLSPREGENAADLDRQDPVQRATTTYREELKTGLRYVWRTVVARILWGSLAATFFMGVVMATLPDYASFRGGGPGVYGLLLAAQTAGLLLGTLLAPRVGSLPLGQTVVVAFGLGGAAWLISILVPWTAPSLVLFGIAWIPAGLSSVLFMSVLQRLVPSHLLGRVTSAVVSASSATMPVGSLLGGLVGDIWGSVPLLAASGAGFLGVGLYWLFHPSLRAFPALEAEMPEEYGFQTLGEGACLPWTTEAAEAPCSRTSAGREEESPLRYIE